MNTKIYEFFNKLKNIELVSFYGSLVSRKNLLDLHEGVIFLFIWTNLTGEDAGVTNSSSVREINNTVDIFLPLN